MGIPTAARTAAELVADELLRSLASIRRLSRRHAGRPEELAAPVRARTSRLQAIDVLPPPAGRRLAVALPDLWQLTEQLNELEQ